MKTVGEILTTERVKQHKTLLQIHRQTKIPLKTLIALEANDFNHLPPTIFIIGFIKIYSQVLGLSSEKLLAIFRRDWQKKDTKEILPLVLKQSANWRTKLRWTPKITGLVLIFAFIALFLAYFGFQLIKLLMPPTLTIEKPLENQEINQETVEIIGQSSPDTGVYINDQLVNTNEKGRFSYQLRLFPGENTLVVSALDRRQKKTTIIRKIKMVVDKKY